MRAIPYKEIMLDSSPYCQSYSCFQPVWCMTEKLRERLSLPSALTTGLLGNMGLLILAVFLIMTMGDTFVLKAMLSVCVKHALWVPNKPKS